MELLDPKLDVVFKLLFADRRNERLLRSLLRAVLRPEQEIARVTVIDPELPKDLATDRGVRLDVLVELADGRLVDVEMECDLRRAHGERWLYHWARLYSGRLRRGDQYDQLEPVVCVVFLGAPSGAARFHSIYEVREAHDYRRLCDALAIHLVELAKLEQSATEGEDPALQRWARFLRFDAEAALTSLAKEDPLMAEAKTALELLSREPSAQRLAEMRREAEIERRLDRADARREGREQGLVEGREQGLVEGREQGLAEGRCNALREAIVALCSVLSIELDSARASRLAGAREGDLSAILASLRDRRAWPE